MGLVTALALFLRAFVVSRATLVVENLALRQQLSVLEHTVKRPKLRPRDRRFWVWLSRLWPAWRSVLRIGQPDTVATWHRLGFTLSWRWTSKPETPGRPPIDKGIRDLIRRMARDNPLWGAPHICSELHLLGYDVAQATVSKSMPQRRTPPSQTWRTFLDNHVQDIVAIDFFTVPTLTFRVLYGFLVLRHDQRMVVHCNATEHPTAQWVAPQIVDAFPFDEAPRFLLRDRDAIYGAHDRHPPARAPGSCDCAKPSPSLSPGGLVLGLLSHGASSSVLEAQRADAASEAHAQRGPGGGDTMRWRPTLWLSTRSLMRGISCTAG